MENFLWLPVEKFDNGPPGKNPSDAHGYRVAWTSEGFFPERPIVDFSTGDQKELFQRAISVEISFLSTPKLTKLREKHFSTMGVGSWDRMGPWGPLDFEILYFAVDVLVEKA